MSPAKSCPKLLYPLGAYFLIDQMLKTESLSWVDEWIALPLESGTYLSITPQLAIILLALFLMSLDIIASTKATDSAIWRGAICIGIASLFGSFIFILPQTAEATYIILYAMFLVEVVVDWVILARVARHDISIGE